MLLNPSRTLLNVLTQLHYDLTELIGFCLFLVLVELYRGGLVAAFQEELNRIEIEEILGEAPILVLLHNLQKHPKIESTSFAVVLLEYHAFSNTLILKLVIIC